MAHMTPTAVSPYPCPSHSIPYTTLTTYTTALMYKGKIGSRGSSGSMGRLRIRVAPSSWAGDMGIFPIYSDHRPHLVLRFRPDPPACWVPDPATNTQGLARRKNASPAGPQRRRRSFRSDPADRVLKESANLFETTRPALTVVDDPSRRVARPGRPRTSSGDAPSRCPGARRRRSPPRGMAAGA